MNDYSEEKFDNPFDDPYEDILNAKPVAIKENEEQEKETKEELTQKKEDVNSLEYIEQTAREKLDMYYPNERVYVDAGM